jgi:hypothetical protein
MSKSNKRYDSDRYDDNEDYGSNSDGRNHKKMKRIDRALKTKDIDTLTHLDELDD